MLEPRLEIFAQALAFGKSQSDAYREMIPKSKAKDATIWDSASKLAAKPEVIQRVKELQQESKERFLISVGQKRMWLNQVISRSLQAEEVFDNNGESIGQFKFQGGDVIRAINELNKMDGDHAPAKQEYKLSS
ncbi:conserved hypothetical protein [Bathymodiolus platifrons methanotrophic gill symbiont]|uniref:hypothetical protein n=1 Tax=Bathymodiolus platifrons methanotrophic gill symbiont TaxID=113268 RepID=UPI000B422824|nr:hypothetical protein [Bathymodiolus platifrons methanotrophic gill symbiont]TXK95634.1 hypothetical protein BMR02_12510 [Methylococcaceae bacterium HT1]TXL12540.1 hypothetical protein BMR05_15075 [Methylococcaceae bacterium HT4]TXL13518.1 hypothetical protein BMR04_14260 [Methylococcaceae bacterium HT3]TXL16832.1 hypothetical protein BMR06_15450 [Methylococcaceae bacterium HT5]TXL20544.1 hypothetical protein BMR03_14355 [Methylococcaceae bacterium HT2]